MDVERFKERCESVILVDELPPLSRLRQKVAGCYTHFGMCPEGEVVGLEITGQVSCLRAESLGGRSICEEDGFPCPFQARPSSILGVIQLLRDFMISNFHTKAGDLSRREAVAGLGRERPAGGPGAGSPNDAEYADEDLGISRHLSNAAKARRRPSDPSG